jgi:hypothetical protein
MLASISSRALKSTIVQNSWNRSLATQASAVSSATSTRKYNGNNGGGRQQRQSSWNKFDVAAAFGLSAVTATSVTLMEKQYQLRHKQAPHFVQPDAMIPNKDNPAQIPDKPRLNSPPPRPDLPTYSREEVSEHCDEDSLWYTFRGK